jgi:signal transduction histidine kinase/DNA-binding LacI/PurR family transcriptional regulator
MKRLTIGFLDENSHDEYHGFMMSGVFEAARKYNINVIRFGHFADHISPKGDIDTQMILSLIRQYDLQGLLFLGWARAANFENHDRFRQCFQSMPILSVGRQFDDIPNVYFPGDLYIREILLHLIQVHQLQRIAFISPFYPDSRVQVYRDTLHEFRIFHPELLIDAAEIANLDLTQRAKKAVSILLDKRNADFDAIMSLYNSETVLVISELQRRGLKVPGDVAVTSYEDGEIGKYAEPAFTTIYYPWKELGYYGCEKMYELLTKGNIPISTMVHGRVIIRESCGCRPSSISHAKAGPKNFEKPLAEIQEQELIKLNQEFQKALHRFSFDGTRLVEAFIRDYQAKSGSCFLTELDDEFANISGYHQFLACEETVSILRKLLLPFVIQPTETLLWAENLFQQAQVLLQEKKIAAWAHEEIESKMVRLTLREMSQVFINHFNIPKMMDSLEMYLERLNLPSCYIYLFKETGRQINLFDECILAFEYRDGIRIQSKNNILGTTDQKLPEILFPDQRAYAMNTLLLNPADLYIGFVIFESGPLDERIYQTLSLNIGMAIYGSMLLEKLDSSYKSLVEKSHQEGMMEIANGILHNIRNILNSLNVSVHFIKELANSSSIEDLLKANQLLEENLHDLAGFVSNDPKGQKLMQFYLHLDHPLLELQRQLLSNTERLSDKVNLVNDIVTAQQSYTGTQSVREVLEVIPIIEDALKINLASLEKNHIQIVKNYHDILNLWGQRTKLFHILVNLIKNAQEAMLETPMTQRKLTITIEKSLGHKYIRITDTGYGVAAGNLESIFAYGYTTKKGGHGFGLYSCGNYMAEMKGKIWAESDGPGKGATFILEFNDD